MIANLEWNSLFDRQNELRIVYKLFDIYAHDILAFHPSNHDTTGHHLRFFQVPTRVSSFQHFFFPSTTKLWNALPDSIAAITSLEIFKSKIYL